MKGKGKGLFQRRVFQTRVWFLYKGREGYSISNKGFYFKRVGGEKGTKKGTLRMGWESTISILHIFTLYLKPFRNYIAILFQLYRFKLITISLLTLSLYHRWWVFDPDLFHTACVRIACCLRIPTFYCGCGAGRRKGAAATHMLPVCEEWSKKPLFQLLFGHNYSNYHC